MYDELVIGLGCEDNYHDVPVQLNIRIASRRLVSHGLHMKNFLVLVAAQL